MFNTICHQGNSNYDSSEILLHTHDFITLENLSSQSVENSARQWKLSCFAGVCVQNGTRSLENFGSFLSNYLYPYSVTQQFYSSVSLIVVGGESK